MQENADTLSPLGLHNRFHRSSLRTAYPVNLSLSLPPEDLSPKFRYSLRDQRTTQNAPNPVQNSRRSLREDKSRVYSNPSASSSLQTSAVFSGSPKFETKRAGKVRDISCGEVRVGELMEKFEEKPKKFTTRVRLNQSSENMVPKYVPVSVPNIRRQHKNRSSMRCELLTWLLMKSAAAEAAKEISRSDVFENPPSESWVTVHNLKSLSDGGILDPDDKLNDVADDREQLLALFDEQGAPPSYLSHNGGDGTSASSVGTESPDIFHVSVQPLEDGKIRYCTDNDVEITGDQIPLGITPLQVRRGSEPALNQLSPSNMDPTKRWSTAVVLGDKPCDMSTPRKSNHPESSDDELPSEREDGSGEEKSSSLLSTSAFSRFSRDSGRLSILGNNPEMLRWADAADRQLMKHMEGQREPPLGGVSSPVQHESHTDRGNKFNSLESQENDLIVLRTDGGPLGIHVVPDFDEKGRDLTLVIQRIEEGSYVHRDGRLHERDRITEINGTCLAHVSFQRAQEIFKDAMQRTEIHLRVKRCLTNGVTELGKTNGHSEVNYFQSGSLPRRSRLGPPPPVYPKPGTRPAVLGSNAAPLPVSNGESSPSYQKELDAGYPSIVLSSTPEGPNSLNERYGSGRSVLSSCSSKKSSSSATTNPLMASNTRRIGRKINIQLVKGDLGLGFSITTRDNIAGGNCPIYIKNILPRGAAVTEGSLRAGDRLLEVNGIEMTGKSQTEAVTFLRTIPEGGLVNLVVSRQEAESPKLPRQLISPSQLNNFNSVDSIPPLFSPNEKSEDALLFPWKHREILMYDIPLNDSGSAGLGVSVKGKTSTSGHGTHDLGIFVKSIINGGAASKDARLKENDQLVNVNGVSLLGLSNTDAMDTLRRVMQQGGPKAGMITLTVARRVPSPRRMHNDQSNIENIPFQPSSSTPMQRTPLSGGRTPTPDTSYSQTSENTVIFLPLRNPASPDNDSANSNGTMVEDCDLGTDLPGDAPKTARELILDKLTGVRPLRNESYYRASHDSWTSTPAKEISVIHRIQEPVDTIQSYQRTQLTVKPLEPSDDPKRESVSSTSDLERQNSDPNFTYVSQMSLDEAGTNFSRDGFGRQSMSEKRNAVLDAKNTDTYQRNKKAREERERMKQEQLAQEKAEIARVCSMQTTGERASLVRASSADSIISVVQNTAQGITREPVNVKRSNSLESVDANRQQEEDIYGRHTAGQPPRNRGCNESFRAAVDRSYGPNQTAASPDMETVDEEAENSVPPKLPQRPSELTGAEEVYQMAKRAANTSQEQKKKGLLKNLGSVFKFGKNRKSDSNEGTTSPVEVDKHRIEAEKLQARQVALAEQERIREQYHKLLERQRQITEEAAKANKSANSQWGIPAGIPGGGLAGHQNQQAPPRQDRISVLRAQHQRRHAERQGQYPNDDTEERLSKQTQEQLDKKMDAESTAHRRTNSYRTCGTQRFESDVVHSRSHSYDLYLESERPQSRHGTHQPAPQPVLLPSQASLADTTKYSHYMNYEEIQQHLRNQQVNLLSSNQAPRRDRKARTTAETERPVSNYFEYDSSHLPPPHIESRKAEAQPQSPLYQSNSLPRRSHHSNGVVLTHTSLGPPSRTYHKQHPPPPVTRAPPQQQQQQPPQLSRSLPNSRHNPLYSLPVKQYDNSVGLPTKMEPKPYRPNFDNSLSSGSPSSGSNSSNGNLQQYDKRYHQHHVQNYYGSKQPVRPTAHYPNQYIVNPNKYVQIIQRREAPLPGSKV